MRSKRRMLALAGGHVDGRIERAQEDHEHDEEGQRLGQEVATQTRPGREVASLDRKGGCAAVG
jgi:hypothetical protein